MSTPFKITTALPPTVGPGAVGPYLVPPQSNPFTASQPLVIWVSQVCAPATTASTPGVTATQPAPTQGDFTLTFAPTQGAAPGLFAVVTVQPTNLYTDSRAALQASFVKFRQQVEALELQNALIVGGARLLLARVASALPLRFDEILFYHYGLDPARQCIDLQPGMQLRVEYGGYQYCDGPGGPGFALNAYTGQGVSRFAITQLADGTLSFDPFTARFAPGYALNPPIGCPLPTAGLIDLQAAGNARRHLRLVYPPVFAGAGSVDNAGASSQTSCILLGADTFTDLEAATADILNGNLGCGTATSGDNPVVSAVFTGRTIATPEMAVFLRNALVYVPVGTTMRGVMQVIADPAPAQVYDPNNQVTLLYGYLWRWFQTTDPSIMPNTNNYGQVTFSFPTPPLAPAPCGDQWDLPLLKGDSVGWHVAQTP